MIINTFQNMQIFVTTMLQKNALNYANTIAIKNDKIQLSYLVLYEKVDKVVNQLQSVPFKNIKNVGLLFNDSVNLLIFHLALYRIGICQTVLFPFDPFSVQKKTIESTEIDLIIQDIDTTEQLILRTITVSADQSITLSGFDDTDQNNGSLFDPEVPAMIFLGSGTTGIPKVIAIDSIGMAKIIYRDIQMCLSLDYKEKDIFFSSSNLYFTFPRRLTLGILFLGLTVLLPQKKPQLLIPYYEKYNIKHMLLTSSQAIQLVQEKQKYTMQASKYKLLHDLKSMMLFGSSISEPLRKNMYTQFTENLFILYGANEFGQGSVANLENMKRYPYTVGKAAPGVEMKIMDEEGNSCEANKSGMIAVKTDFMLSAYLNNPIETKKHFKDGYFYPGDMGHFTSDGQLIFEGRADDMIIFTGVNIYPIEIESVLETHPNVQEAAVFPLKNHNHEELPFAVVTLLQTTSEKDLLRWCRKSLGWKLPIRIFITNRMPRNTLGKILKRELQEKVKKTFYT